jgi:hypothetical protein
MTAPAPARLRHLARQIHRLGPGPLHHLLRELVDGADPLPRIEAYARLAPLADFIVAHSGAPALRVITGGRR